MDNFLPPELTNVLGSDTVMSMTHTQPLPPLPDGLTGAQLTMGIETVTMTVHRCPECGTDHTTIEGQRPGLGAAHLCCGVPIQDIISVAAAEVQRCIRCGATTDYPASSGWVRSHLRPPAVVAMGRLDPICTPVRSAGVSGPGLSDTP